MTPIWAWISCLIIVAQIIAPSQCEEWPQCKFQCRANDVTVSRLWLGDDKGEAFAAQGVAQSCYLWGQFHNNANSPRYAVILLADLLVNGSVVRSFYDDGLCVLDSIEAKATQSYPLCNLVWTGGETATLSRLVLSWETAAGTDCSQASRRCSNRNTKCYSSQEVAVQVPLIASFSADMGDCSSGRAALYDRTSGGIGPYIYDWDFGDGSQSRENSPVHIFAAAGDYMARLQVSDQSGTVSTFSRQISVKDCSCRISGEGHACLHKVGTYWAEFSGGSPDRVHWMLDGGVIGPGETHDEAGHGENGEIEGGSEEREERDEEIEAGESSIEIDWSNYGPGLHDLRAYVMAKDETVAAQCNITVHVLTEPVATISLLP